jgi:hypothetical protein
MKQTCAYADYIAIVARNVLALKEVFLEIEKEAEKMGLIVKEAKTKYMVMTTSKTRRAPQNIKLSNMIFEGMSQFKYFGVVINSECRMTDCVKDETGLETGHIMLIFSCLETTL